MRPTGNRIHALEPVPNDSPAGKAGLSSGVIILKADGTESGGIDKLLLILNADRIGRATGITVCRKGEVFERMLNPVEKGD